MNQDFQHQHQWITPQNHKGLKCLHSQTYQCDYKQTGTYCPSCHIYLCSSHKPKQKNSQGIEDWFIEQKQRYIQVKQLIKIIEKNFKGQGQQFKTGQFKGDWMYPGNNGIEYHIHYSNSGYIGHKSSSWSADGRVCLQRIGKQYKSIQEIPQKQAVNQKAKFLLFIRQLMEIVKSQYQ